MRCKTMSSLYFEDFEVDSTFETPGRTITETDLMMFAGLSGDYHALHTDEEYAKQTRYGQRVVHGLLGISIATGLMSRSGIFEDSVVALLGINNWKFLKPIFIGDTIRVRFTITEKRLSKSNNETGILGRYYELINQKDEVIQHGEMPALIKTREAKSE